MKPWKNAATLMLAARYGQSRATSPAVHNYKLLCLKRHQKSNFMPGLYVFPGGAVDSADSDLKWREYFNVFGLDNDKLASLVPRTKVSRPQIFRTRENELLREISLRITAIRETFEECGILICRRDKSAGAAHSGWADHVSIPDSELRTWQSKVHNDGMEFFNLCRKLECYPDLWALHEWRNWMPPTIAREDKRFNTVFYMACIPYVPQTKYETVEMEDLKWDTPELSSTDITFPPPQQYEIAWLTKIKNIDNLLDIAMERNKEGVQRMYIPVNVQTKDGNVYVLPGDTMYPKKVDLLEKQMIDKSDITVDQFGKITPIKNRLEFLDSQVVVVCTDNVSGEDTRVYFQCPIRPFESNIQKCRHYK